MSRSLRDTHFRESPEESSSTGTTSPRRSFCASPSVDLLPLGFIFFLWYVYIFHSIDTHQPATSGTLASATRRGSNVQNSFSRVPGVALAGWSPSIVDTKLILLFIIEEQMADNEALNIENFFFSGAFVPPTQLIVA